MIKIIGLVSVLLCLMACEYNTPGKYRRPPKYDRYKVIYRYCDGTIDSMVIGNNIHPYGVDIEVNFFGNNPYLRYFDCGYRGRVYNVCQIVQIIDLKRYE